MNRALGYLASTSIAFALLCGPAAAKFILFQVPGATSTFPQAITNSGDVVGQFGDQFGTHGFIRTRDGTFATFDVPGATATVPTAINLDGTVVGWHLVQTDKGTAQLGFIRAPDGEITEFQALNASRHTVPIAITNRGWIAGTGQVNFKEGLPFGFLRKPNGHVTRLGDGLVVRCANATHTTAGQLYDGSQWHGFVRTPDGAIAKFDPNGGSGTAVNAINDAGTATGNSQVGAVSVGFIRAADGTLSTFVPAADAEIVGPGSINKTGAIAGGYADEHGVSHGFVRAADGTITIIDAPQPSTGTGLSSINDKGQATGIFFVNGKTQGLIWKP